MTGPMRYQLRVGPDYRAGFNAMHGSSCTANDARSGSLSLLWHDTGWTDMTDDAMAMLNVKPMNESADSSPSFIEPSKAVGREFRTVLAVRKTLST